MSLVPKAPALHCMVLISSCQLPDLQMAKGFKGWDDGPTVENRCSNDQRCTYHCTRATDICGELLLRHL